MRRQDSMSRPRGEGTSAWFSRPERGPWRRRVWWSRTMLFPVRGRVTPPRHSCTPASASCNSAASPVAASRCAATDLSGTSTALYHRSATVQVLRTSTLRRDPMRFRTICMLALVLGTASAANAQTRLGVSLSIGDAPPPPVIVVRQEPHVVYVPEARVYYVDDSRDDWFRVGTYWYIER